MIQDDMIREVQELKLAGYTPVEVHAELAKRHKKAPTIKTVRKYYNMDCVPEDTHTNLRKQMAFDCEPFRSAIIEIVNLNPDCYMSSVYDIFLILLFFSLFIFLFSFLDINNSFLLII